VPGLVSGARGFSLVELGVAIVMLGVVTAGLYRVVETTHRVTRGQADRAALQANVRAGVLAVPAELREIGVDSAQSGAVRTDLLLMRPDRIRIRAMRGLGFVCGMVSDPAATTGGMLVRSPMLGGVEPALGDSVLVFVENDPATGADDEWARVVPSAVDAGAACPDGTPAHRFALPVAGSPGGLPAPVAARMRPGAPVRLYDLTEYGLYVSDGRSWLGARTLSADPSASWQPVVGPLANGDGFALRYFDRTGVEVPAGGDSTRVRVVEIALRGLTERAVSLGGAAGDAPAVDTFELVTRVALRNALRP
jgi:hypothetical protein